MSELFNSNDIVAIDPSKDYSAELVGEGKKFKDIAALARSKVESDAHISRLEKENRETREELQKRLTLEEVMTKLAQNKQENTPLVISPEVTPAPALTKEQLEALIAQSVSQRVQETEVERTAKQNFDTVKFELQKLWGGDWQSKLEGKTKELGLGKDWLTQLAGAQPKAFLTLMGVSEPKLQETSPFGISPSGINNAALSASAHRGEKTQSYYENLKKTNPKVYFTKEMRQEQYDQAIKLGERYFDLP